MNRQSAIQRLKTMIANCGPTLNDKLALMREALPLLECLDDYDADELVHRITGLVTETV